MRNAEGIRDRKRDRRNEYRTHPSHLHYPRHSIGLRTFVQEAERRNVQLRGRRVCRYDKSIAA
jgi:hypothetical protein